jgi:SAM-dependent methyltransferase
MRFRNKHNINLFDNPMKRRPELLDTKNRLESAWYDNEAQGLLTQLECLPGLMPMDKDFEEWFAQFYNSPNPSQGFDRDYAYFRAFGNVDNLKVLELGSGNGCLSRFLIRRDAEVCSIDLSLEYGRFLARSEPSSMPVRSCAEVLPFQTGVFDIVTSFVALHHFNLDMSLPEIKRALKPGGQGIFMEPLMDSQMLYYLRQLIPIVDNESPGGGGLKTAGLRAAFEELGFSYSIREFEFLTRLERLPGLMRFQRALRKADHLLFSGIPYLRKFARMVVIEIVRE